MGFVSAISALAWVWLGSQNGHDTIPGLICYGIGSLWAVGAFILWALGDIERVLRDDTEGKG